VTSNDISSSIREYNEAKMSINQNIVLKLGLKLFTLVDVDAKLYIQVLLI